MSIVGSSAAIALGAMVVVVLVGFARALFK